MRLPRLVRDLAVAPGQGGRPRARRPGDRAGPHGRRRDRRPARAPRPQRAGPRPRAAGGARRRGQAAARAPRRSPRARPAATSHRRPRRRARHRPGARGAARPSSAVSSRRATRTPSTRAAPRSCSSRRASPPPSTSSDVSGRGVGMDAVRAKVRELGGDVRADVRARRRVARRDPPAADAGHRARAARPQRRRHVRDPARPGRAHRAPRRPRRAVRPLASRAPARRPCAPADLRRRVARRRRRVRRRLRRAAARRGTERDDRAARRRARRPARARRAPAARGDGHRRARSPAPPCSPTATSRSSSTPTGWAHAMTRYTEQQLDALGELANIGSGTAGTALSTLIGRPVDISVPHVRALPVERGGGRRRRRRPRGPRDARPDHAATCRAARCCVPAGGRGDAVPHARRRPRRRGRRAPPSREIGNILCTSYINGAGRDAGHGARARARRRRRGTCSARSWQPSCSARARPTTRSSWTPSCSSRARASACRASCCCPPGGHRRAPRAPGPVTAATDIVVRMGELAVSADAGRVLVTLGLGSCIGVVLVDRIRRVAGLAHVMLPRARRPGRRPARRRARQVRRPRRPGAARRDAGRRRPPRSAWRSRSSAAPRCSARGSGSLDIGARNEAAVREALAAARLPSARPRPAAARAAPCGSRSVRAGARAQGGGGR